MTAAELRRLEELAANARRAVKATQRLARIAGQTLAQLDDEISDIRQRTAQGGNAHDRQHQPELARR